MTPRKCEKAWSDFAAWCRHRGLRALPAHGRSKAAGVREWIAALLAWRVTHVLYNPLLVFVRFIGAYYLLYFTPIFDFALRYHWSHQLMNAEFIVIGVMFYGLVIGVDAPPRPIPHLTWIFVNPWTARQGVGSALLDAVVRGLRSEGYDRLGSSFLLGNDSSTLWHWRNGFRLISFTGAYRLRRSLRR